jgi:hypothetical protein
VPRLRQAVFAVRDLDAAVAVLRSSYGLVEPYADPAVEYFGLRNAVFAIGDTFLELVSPVADDTAAGRQIERRGGDCGYMAMLQVDDVAAARQRARRLDIGEVFEVEFDDITEAHLHPAQIGGAIVSVSEPRPASSWRWGGPGWDARSAEGSLAGLTVGVADAGAVATRWQEVAGGAIPVTFVDDPSEPGILAAELELGGRRVTVEPGDLAP